jgi:hypothetical protein
MHFDVPSFPHIHRYLFLFFPFLEFMALRMITSYRPQTTQVNEEPPLGSSLDLTLM